MSRDAPSRPNHDQLFKELLHTFLPEFLLLVAPRQAHRLKLEHGHFLDQETFADFPEGDLRRADVVYATETLDGEPQWILVHFEVESRFRGDFDQRMAHYGLSLFLRHRVPVFPLAIFLQGGGEGDREIYPRVVQLDAAGFWFHRYRYLAFALSRGQAERYLERQDPFAAALAALMPFTSGSPAEHKLYCLQRILATRELNPARSFQLAHLVDTYIQLDTDEEDKFQNLTTDIVGKEMEIMETSWDRALAERHRAGLKEGQNTGLKAGMRRILIGLLKSRFGDLPEPVTQQVEACEDPEQLQRWSEAVLTAPDLRAMGLA